MFQVKRKSIVISLVVGALTIGMLYHTQFANHALPLENEESESQWKPSEMPGHPPVQGDNMTMAAFQAQKMKMEAEANPLLDAKWENLGPTGVGRVMVCKIDPKDEKIIYILPANGGVWKSTDKGNNWKCIFDKDKDGKPVLSQSMGDIAIAPSDSKILWLGTGGTECGGGSLTYPGMGVYMSKDAGATWEYKGLEKSYYIGRVTIHPTNPDIVYVAAMGTMFWGNKERGVYRTKDGGKTWKQVLYVDTLTGAIDVRIWPKDPKRVFACMWKRVRHTYWRDFGGGQSRIWRSNDDGENWSQVSNGLPTSDLGKNTLCISPSNPDILYCIYERSNCQIKGIYRSTDGGGNWSRVGSPPSSIFNYWGYWYGQIRVHPRKPAEVVTFGVNAFRSTNSGSSWSGIASGIHVDHHDISWSRQDPNFVIWVNDGGVYKGTSGAGSRFSKIGTKSLTQGGVSIAQCYNIEIASKNNKYRYAALQDNGVLMTTSGATTGWKSIIGGDGEMIRVDPSNNRYAYGCLQNGAYYRSSSSGNNMARVPKPAGRSNWCSPVAIDSLDGNVYIATNYVYKSNRGGTSFSRISNDLSNGDHSHDIYAYGNVYALEAFNNVIYAGTDDGNLWVSKNDGGNWTKVRSGEGWIKKVHIDKTVSNGSTAYYCVWLYRWGKNKWKPTVFKTTDFGANWKDITGDLPSSITTIECLIDHAPARKGWLYLATDWGVYMSVNEGTNWSFMGKDLPILPVNDMVLHPDGHLYAGTWGRGVYRLPLNTVNTNYTNNGLMKNGQLLKNQPNPVISQTNITFSVNKSAPVLLAIYDMRGRTVRTLINKEQRQAHKHHTVTWDRRDNRGARVSAGNYICRVITDHTTLAHKILVK